jgi:signal transduction histidine kinase
MSLPESPPSPFPPIFDAAALIAELEQFTTVLVHDLKSPLVTVAGFAHLLRSYVRKQDMAQILDAADRIEQGTRRMSSMLDGLSEYVDVARDPLDWQDLDLAALVNEILSGMQTRLAARGVEVQRPSALPTVRADARRLTLALQHMLRNAVEHGCREGGVVRLDAESTPDAVRISVSDSGPGIPVELRERIFRLFQRFHPHATGPGIGLATIQRVARLHGGNARVEHPDGGGLRIILEIPNLRVPG